MVVDGENKARVRRVQRGVDVGAGVDVTTGLEEGDQVITEGIQKIGARQVVSATPVESPKAPGGGVGQ